jgi:hypothetical protein
MKTKLRTILNGWKNTLITDSKIEAVAQVRLSICNGCDKKTTQLGIDVCGECHCPLVAKVRSNDTCPLNKWT